MYKFLLEANVLNMDQINKQLNDLATHVDGGPLLDPYKSQWIKAVANDVMNNEQYHQLVTELPMDSPIWAKSAFERKDLVTANIDSQVNALKDILHWLLDLINVSKKIPINDIEKEDKALAVKQLNSLTRMTLTDMSNKQREWFARHTKRSDESGSVDGMTKVADVGNNYSWWKLDTDNAFNREGQVLQNCIGKIWTLEQCNREKQVIIILKDGEYQSHAALRYSPNKKTLHEVKGMNNKPPISSLMPFTNRIIQQMQLEPDYVGNLDLNNAGYIFDKDNKRIYHVSEKYPFENGPKLSQNLMLVKWTAPQAFLTASMRGNNMVGTTQSNTRWDLIHKKNKEHTVYSFMLNNINDQTVIVAIGNLPSTTRIISSNGMTQMIRRLSEVAGALNAIIPDNFTGTVNNPGLNRYGITVKNNQLDGDHFLAIEVSVNASPESIKSVKNPPERLQLMAVGKKPDLLTEIDNPSENTQIVSFQKTHDAGALMAKFLQTRNNIAPSIKVQEAAIENWPYVIDSLLFANPPPGDEIILKAVRKNGESLWHICKQFKKLQRNTIDRVIIRAALLENSDSIGALLRYNFEVNPIDIINAVENYEHAYDVEIIQEYLEKYNYNNSEVNQAIAKKIIELGKK